MCWNGRSAEAVKRLIEDCLAHQVFDMMSAHWPSFIGSVDVVCSKDEAPVGVVSFVNNAGHPAHQVRYVTDELKQRLPSSEHPLAV